MSRNNNSPSPSTSDYYPLPTITTMNKAGTAPLAVQESHFMHEYEDEDMDGKTPSMCSVLSCAVGCVLCPFSLFSCFVVNPREEVVVLDYGKYNGTVRTPGCHYVCLPGRTLKTVSTKIKSITLPETKTIDRNGNPLTINGILAYQVRNTKKAALDVENVDHYIVTQGLAALKQIVSRYPYESEEGHCLKTDSEIISREMVGILQDRVKIAGVLVNSFTFNEISYAPEIASGMLKRQQASAILQARKLIVHGAVEIAHGAVTELQERGIILDDQAKGKVVSNLLTVICSESSTTPVLPLTT